MIGIEGYDSRMSERRLDATFEISVLMLAKNKERYLGQAAMSVMEYKDVQLVLIEPGSTDDSRKVCEKLEREHLEKVSLITKSDASASEGLNNGLNVAQGSIVGVLNGDDMYLPGALHHVSNYFISNPQVDVLLSSGFLINENSGKWKFVLPSKISRKVLGLGRHGSLTFFHQGMFYRKDQFPNVTFNPRNRINWDKEFLIELWTQGARIGYCDIPVAIFRLNNDSITSRGFSKASLEANTAELDLLLQYNSNSFFAPLLGLIFRLSKALSLARHTLKIHMSSFKMSETTSENQ
jgi:glycosyltransferase involved in cell wall biosynthesis